MVKAREVLSDIWNTCLQMGFVGRCWGKRGAKSESAFPGSNITLCDGDTIVVIFQEGASGQIRTRSFVAVDKTPFEKEIRDRLKEAGML